MQFTNQKLILSGHILEHDQFERPVIYGTNYHVRRKRTGQTITAPAELLKKSARRAKSALRRLVNSNARKWYKPSRLPYLPIFITFTFKADIRDLTTANNLFTDFTERFNYFINGGDKKHSLKYITVVEFQDKNRDGVIHYHTLFFNLPFVSRIYDEVKRIWRHGNTNIKSVYKIDDLGKYMVGYMEKSMLDGRLKGRKKYFCSRGLIKYHTIYESETVDFIIQQLPAESKLGTGSWTNSHTKKITRTTYNLLKYPEAIDWVYHLMVK